MRKLKKLLLLVIESLVGCALIFGFFYVLGIIEMWAEKHLLVFFVVMGVILAKMFYNEFCE